MTYFNTPGIVYGPYINKEVRYQQSKVQVFPCNQNTIILEDESEKGYNSQGATPSEQVSSLLLAARSPVHVCWRVI